jgi:hypothetical protein
MRSSRLPTNLRHFGDRLAAAQEGRLSRPGHSRAQLCDRGERHGSAPLARRLAGPCYAR